MKISVIIVSYNARYHLEQCLYSVEKALENTNGEIIVVDNASPEKTVDFLHDKFPNVQFIESKENLGFAKANNLGVEKARGEYVLILNPDTLIPENLFEVIFPFADSKNDLGALGVRMIDANGKFHLESKRNIPNFQNTFGKLFGTLVNKNNSKGYYKTEVAEFENAPAEILTGAFMLMKKDVYKSVGGFDPRYFMYGEDIDLNYTLVLNKFVNYYFGQISILHYKGESTRKDKKYLKIFFGAMDLFIKKYYRNNFIEYSLYRLGLKVRHMYANLIGRFKDEDLKLVKSVDFNELIKIKSESDINEKTAQILLDGSLFSNREMIEVISKYHLAGREFYIHPKKMNVIIGDSGIKNY